MVATTGGAAEAVSILTAARSIQHRENSFKKKKSFIPLCIGELERALGYSLV